MLVQQEIIALDTETPKHRETTGNIVAPQARAPMKGFLPFW